MVGDEEYQGHWERHGPERFGVMQIDEYFFGRK